MSEGYDKGMMRVRRGYVRMCVLGEEGLNNTSTDEHMQERNIPNGCTISQCHCIWQLIHHKLKSQLNDYHHYNNIFTHSKQMLFFLDRVLHYNITFNIIINTVLACIGIIL